jgi:hypothetical protein
MNDYETHTEVGLDIRTDTQNLAGGTRVDLTPAQVYSGIEVTQPRGEFRIKPLRVTILPSVEEVKKTQERHNLHESLYALREAGLKIAKPCHEYNFFKI